MATMAKLTSSVGSYWANDALSVIKKINSLYYLIDEEAQEELEAIDKAPK